MAAEPVKAADLDKARNRFESQQLMSYVSVANKAFGLACHEVLGDADGINREQEQYMSVTAEEIASIAGLTFRSGNCSVINYLPGKRRETT